MKFRLGQLNYFAGIAYIVVLCILFTNLNLIYILCLLHHARYCLKKISVVCLYNCVYEDPTENKSTVYFNVHCI